MKNIKLQIPETGCVDCPYLQTLIIDHNYYGEKTAKCQCVIFPDATLCAQNVLDTSKEEEKNRDTAKYADYLVKEINKKGSKA